jgi:TPR repeat protein
MKRLHFSLKALICLGFGWITPVQADTLDLAFMPPAVVPQDLCIPGATTDEEDTDIGLGDDELTDELRIRYIQRDIRNLQADDANRWFDFIMTLIDWEAELDPAYAEAGAILARIALYIDAGRLDELRDLRLIDQLRQSTNPLPNAARMVLAQYYLSGTGVAQDIGYANNLIREAAYGGNPDALFSIARSILQGEPIPEWDAPLDMTVTLAFGGMLGQMNADVCRHAEKIAQEYLDGDVVTRNPEIAYAWYKFGADLGGATAAWRIVEFHLEADAARKDNAEMLKYLQLAVARGIAVDAVQAEHIRAASDLDDAQLRDILGFNFSADDGRTRPSLSGYFQLTVNLDSEVPSKDSPYLTYLTELTQFDTAPGWVFTTLAQEILLRKGRWAGEAEAMALLEEAVRRGDALGMQMLATMLVRYRDDPAQLNRAANLLAEAVSRFGKMSAMNDLDGLYRCQSNDAPLLEQADHWAAAFRATQSETVGVSPTDLIVLDPYKAPETLAQVQSQALRGDPQSLANYLELVQVDPLATDDAQRIWASRTDGSAKALENFAELEFTLATNPAERDLAVELFRRIYLNNGVTTALDLSVALTEDNSRDPTIAADITGLLTMAGNRGEGAAIRLLSRLPDGERTPQTVFAQFAQVIEERGDFLALMFAIPYISTDKTDDYIDRAVSLMTCGTKDAEELGDAYAILQSPELSYHWRQIGLNIEYGHVLAKLAISDRQMDAYGTGAAPTQRQVFERALSEGDLTAHRSLFLLTANPDLPSYDPTAAASHLTALLAFADEQSFVLENYRIAAPEVRAAIAAQQDIGGLLLRAAQGGDIVAKREYALVLRDTAASLTDLQSSVRWLTEAAEGGDIEAMAELGRAMALGIGVPQDSLGALKWLEQAERVGNADAAALARLLRLQVVR